MGAIAQDAAFLVAHTKEKLFIFQTFSGSVGAGVLTTDIIPCARHKSSSFLPQEATLTFATAGKCSSTERVTPISQQGALLVTEAYIELFILSAMPEYCMVHGASGVRGASIARAICMVHGTRMACAISMVHGTKMIPHAGVRATNFRHYLLGSARCVRACGHVENLFLFLDSKN